jgi:hypothetical protein
MPTFKEIISHLDSRHHALAGIYWLGRPHKPEIHWKAGGPYFKTLGSMVAGLEDFRDEALLYMTGAPEGILPGAKDLLTPHTLELATTLELRQLFCELPGHGVIIGMDSQAQWATFCGCPVTSMGMLHILMGELLGSVDQDLNDIQAARDLFSQQGLYYALGVLAKEAFLRIPS